MAKKLTLVVGVDISAVPPEKFQSVPLVGDRVGIARDGFLQLSGEVLEVHDRPWDDPGGQSREQAIQEQEMADREEEDDCTCRKWGIAACWVHGDTPC